MKEILFRTTTLSDIPALLDLHFSMNQEERNGNLSQRIPHFEKSLADYFQKSMQSKAYFGAIAEKNNTVLSMGGLVLYQRPPVFQGNTGLVGYIVNVYTLPSFRRQGFGTEVMKMLISTAQEIGASKIHLGTTPEGRGLYEKLGFKDSAMPSLELRF